MTPTSLPLPWQHAGYDTCDNTSDRRLDLDAIVLARTCVYVDGSGDGDIALFFGELPENRKCCFTPGICPRRLADTESPHPFLPGGHFSRDVVISLLSSVKLSEKSIMEHQQEPNNLVDVATFVYLLSLLAHSNPTNIGYRTRRHATGMHTGER